MGRARNWAIFESERIVNHRSTDLPVRRTETMTLASACVCRLLFVRSQNQTHRLVKVDDERQLVKKSANQ